MTLEVSSLWYSNSCFSNQTLSPKPFQCSPSPSTFIVTPLSCAERRNLSKAMDFLFATVSKSAPPKSHIIYCLFSTQVNWRYKDIEPSMNDLIYNLDLPCETPTLTLFASVRSKEVNSFEFDSCDVLRNKEKTIVKEVVTVRRITFDLNFLIAFQRKTQRSYRMRMRSKSK